MNGIVVSILNPVHCVRNILGSEFICLHNVTGGKAVYRIVCIAQLLELRNLGN